MPDMQHTLYEAEHEDFRAMVRAWAEKNVAPFHAQWEKDGVVSREVWERAGALGLLLTAIPEEHGGQGGDFLFSVIMAEELARAGMTGPYFHLHSDIIAPYISMYGTDEQRQAWLPRMAAGEAIAAIARRKAESAP